MNRKHDPDAVYRFIVLYKKQNGGNYPSTRAIGHAFGIGSTSTVAHIVCLLAERGWLTLSNAGAIGVVGEQWRYLPPAGAPVVEEALIDAVRTAPEVGES